MPILNGRGTGRSRQRSADDRIHCARSREQMPIESTGIEQIGVDLRFRFDDVVEIVVVFGQVVIEGGYAPAYRKYGLMHRLAAAADQMVPPVEIVAFGDQPIGAGRRSQSIVRTVDGVSRTLSGTMALRLSSVPAGGRFPHRAGGRRPWSSRSRSLSSSSSLDRQHLPRPSHSDSHCSGVIASSGRRFQKGFP